MEQASDEDDQFLCGACDIMEKSVNDCLNSSDSTNIASNEDCLLSKVCDQLERSISEDTCEIISIDESDEPREKRTKFDENVTDKTPNEMKSNDYVITLSDDEMSGSNSVTSLDHLAILQSPSRQHKMNGDFIPRESSSVKSDLRRIPDNEKCISLLDSPPSKVPRPSQCFTILDSP